MMRKKHVDLHGHVVIRDGMAMTENGTFYDLAEYTVTTHGSTTICGDPRAQGLEVPGMNFGPPAELLGRPKQPRRALGLESGIASAALLAAPVKR